MNPAVLKPKAFLKMLGLCLFILPGFWLRAQTPVYYVMMMQSGTYGYGTITWFDPATQRDSVAWNLGNGIDGKYPTGDLVFNPGMGLFYGMTTSGGTDTLGTIISFDPVTNAENVVWSFRRNGDGAYPRGNLLYDAGTGLMYGLTTIGGLDSGVIFIFDPATNTDSVVWKFGTRTADGSQPAGTLVYNAGTGLFYGTTSFGGSHGQGTIFSFNPVTGMDSVLWNFGAGADGVGPEGALVYDSATGLYLSTTNAGGGIGLGTIYSFDPLTNAVNKLWNFGGSGDGIQPFGTLVYDPANALYYGMTYAGGSHNNGTVFSFNASTHAEQVVDNLGNGRNGSHPYGSFVYDVASGDLYGLTTQGGFGADGVFFSFAPGTAADTTLFNFGAHTTGDFPYGTPVLYSPRQVVTSTTQILNASASAEIYPNPLTDRTTLKYSLRAGSKSATLVIYDLLGIERKVFKLNAADGQMYVNCNNLGSGVYFYSLMIDDKTVLTKKMVLQ